jgi:iron complex transport system permease protein
MMLVVAAVMTAAAVAFTGVIGFVGLIVPHMVRLVVGADHRILVPAATLTGAIFLILADTVARAVIAPTELPVGIITALCGGPFFLYLLRRNRLSGEAT